MSLQRLGVSTRLVNVGLVVNKVEHKMSIIEFFRTPGSIIPPVLTIHISFTQFDATYPYQLISSSNRSFICLSKKRTPKSHFGKTRTHTRTLVSLLVLTIQYLIRSDASTFTVMFRRLDVVSFPEKNKRKLRKCQRLTTAFQSVLCSLSCCC